MTTPAACNAQRKFAGTLCEASAALPDTYTPMKKSAEKAIMLCTVGAHLDRFHTLNYDTPTRGVLAQEQICATRFQKIIDDLQSQYS